MIDTDEGGFIIRIMIEVKIIIGYQSNKIKVNDTFPGSFNLFLITSSL